jgi:hypothetical protein
MQRLVTERPECQALAQALGLVDDRDREVEELRFAPRRGWSSGA